MYVQCTCAHCSTSVPYLFSSLQSVVIDFAYSQQNYTKKENLLIISKLLDNSQNHVENVIHVYDI